MDTQIDTERQRLWNEIFASAESIAGSQIIIDRLKVQSSTYSKMKSYTGDHRPNPFEQIEKITEIAWEYYNKAKRSLQRVQFSDDGKINLDSNRAAEISDKIDECVATMKRCEHTLKKTGDWCAEICGGIFVLLSRVKELQGCIERTDSTFKQTFLLNEHE